MEILFKPAPSGAKLLQLIYHYDPNLSSRAYYELNKRLTIRENSKNTQVLSKAPKIPNYTQLICYYTQFFQIYSSYWIIPNTLKFSTIIPNTQVIFDYSKYTQVFYNYFKYTQVNQR